MTESTSQSSLSPNNIPQAGGSDNGTEVRFEANGSCALIHLSGRIDSANAVNVEREITAPLTGGSFDSVNIDCEDLKYISSAGLRIILRLKKEYDALTVSGVAPDVYDIFEMTGFTEMLEIKRAYRRLSIDGCTVIGKGANGTVYRIDRDTIVKVYRDADALPAIEKERELARKAFVMGIPTAIPYDVVRVGNSFGSVFELLNARSFADIMIEEPEQLDEIVRLTVDLMHKLHSTELKPGDMPDMRATARKWVLDLNGALPEDQYAKLLAMVDAMPEDNHMIHGDLHLKNVMLQNGEVLLIDMDTLCLGHPVFELAQIYNTYIGFGAVDPNVIQTFLGIPPETGREIWDKILLGYLGTNDPARLTEVTNKASLLGYVRILRRALRHASEADGPNSPEINNARTRISELLGTVDTLLF